MTSRIDSKALSNFMTTPNHDFWPRSSQNRKTRYRLPTPIPLTPGKAARRPGLWCTAFVNRSLCSRAGNCRHGIGIFLPWLLHAVHDFRSGWWKLLRMGDGIAATGCFFRCAIGGQKKGKHRPSFPRALWFPSLVARLSMAILVTRHGNCTENGLVKNRVQEAISVQGLTHWDIRL